MFLSAFGEKRLRPAKNARFNVCWVKNVRSFHQTNIGEKRTLKVKNAR
jgi:hypothetical protein